VSDSTVPEGEQELAGRGTRLAAAIIDSMLLGLIVWPYAMSTGYVERAMQDQIGMSDMLELSLVSLIAFLVVHGYLLHKYGQSIGKRLLGIRIVSATDGQLIRPSLRADSAGRHRSLDRHFSARHRPDLHLPRRSALPA
jgi:uncharacterized RDD family membrane protein YckC